MRPIRKFKLIKPYPNIIHTVGDIVSSTCIEDDRFYTIWPEFWEEIKENTCLFCKETYLLDNYKYDNFCDKCGDALNDLINA